MEGFTKRRWIAVTFVVVILPISLLTTFKLTHILPEVIIAETIERDAVSWNMTRPMGDTAIDEEIKNVYCDEASVELGIYLHSYHRDWSRYGYNDTIAFRVVAATNTTMGFVYSVVIKFSHVDDYSMLFASHENYNRLENLDLKEKYSSATPQREGYVVAVSINQPTDCFLEVEVDWVFIDSNDQNHKLDVTLEATYFNGTTYQRIVLPVTLQMLVPTG